MAAAVPEPQFNLNSFDGESDENWSDFESALRNLIGVGIILKSNQRQVLELPLLDQNLQFFKTLAQAIGDDFDAATTVPRIQYCNPNLQRLHKILLHYM